MVFILCFKLLSFLHFQLLGCILEDLQDFVNTSATCKKTKFSFHFNLGFYLKNLGFCLNNS